ncbi:MAG: hypothetical protein WCN95_14655 [bacterium]
MKSIAIICLLLPLAGCRQKEPQQVSPQNFENGIVAIGVVGSMDAETKSHIKAVLLTNGIEIIPEGSFAVGVIVPKAQADKAMAILKKDTQRKYCWENVIN